MADDKYTTREIIENIFSQGLDDLANEADRYYGGKPLSDGTIPDWLKNKPTQSEQGKVPESITNTINVDIEQNQTNINNSVYQQSVNFYDQNVFQTTSNTYNLTIVPPKPSSLLPVQQGIEQNNQTPTAIKIGAPITLAQSIGQQSFGRLLHNPFTQTKQTVRQVSSTNIGTKLKELNNQGIERFAKYIDGEKDTDAMDAIALFLPVSLRGLAGATGMLFGKETLKFYFANLTAASANALIGVTDTIPNGYEIETYSPEPNDSSNDVEGIRIGEAKDGLSDKIYQILGGENWQTAEDGSLTMAVQPEQLIKTVGNILYNENSNVLTKLTVTNLLELLTAYSSVDFFRSGHHRLPATVPSSLRNTDAGNVPTQIYDVMSFQEWIVRQLDALVGEFPLKLKVKTINHENEEVEEEICLENISEAIAELMPLVLNIANDSDTAINIGMKSLVEAMKAANAAITTYDYAVANAEYLGYKGNETEREIDLTFTPGAKNLKESLKPSKKTIVGWANEDKETLVELIKKTLIASEMVKASIFHPFNPGDKITGDAIKESQETQQTEDDAKWEQFKQRVNNPTGRYDVPKPKAKVKDLTIDNPT